MEPKEILEFILRKENISYPKLAKKMEISRTQPLYDIRDGKIKSISANYANRIIKAFPDSGYTFGFIITGDESLINSEESNKEDEIINEEESNTNKLEGKNSDIYIMYEASLKQILLRDKRIRDLEIKLELANTRCEELKKEVLALKRIAKSS